MALDLRSHTGRQQDQTFEFLLRLTVGVWRSGGVAPFSIASRTRLWARPVFLLVMGEPAAKTAFRLGLGDVERRSGEPRLQAPQR
jgi:hypothetical protein